MDPLPKKAVIAVIAAILYFGGVCFQLPPKVSLAMGDVAQAPVITIPAQTTNSSFSQWLDRLEEAESHSSGNAHYKIVDVNDYYSYGCLQFQAATFLQYGKLYNLIPQGLTNVEPLIYNCSLQKELATDMIAGNYKNWRQWYYSAKNVIGLPPHPEGTLVESR